MESLCLPTFTYIFPEIKSKMLEYLLALRQNSFDKEDEHFERESFIPRSHLEEHGPNHIESLTVAHTGIPSSIRNEDSLQLCLFCPTESRASCAMQVLKREEVKY
jgi:hypothetical protein